MDLRKSLTAAVAGAALAAGVALSAPISAQSVPETDEPIKLAMNEWTGQHITTAVAGEILKRMGYNVEYVTAGYYPQMTALADGDIDATLEIWSSNIGDSYEQAMSTGNVEDLGDLGLQPQEAWFVPAYVVEMCPGLPSWEALNDCAELFSTPETFPNGRFVDYPLDWGDTNAKRIAALGLNYESVSAGSEGAIIAEINSAVERKAPVITMFWTPHWLHAQVDLVRVTLPDYYEGCYEDASLGMNPDMAYDCDWAPGTIMKMVNKDLVNSHPAAYEVLTSYQLSNPDQIAMMNEIDFGGRDLIEVVNEWLDNNESTWKPWVDEASM